MIPTMINMDALISAVKVHVARENATRFGGRERIKVTRYEGEIPNDFRVFIDTPDNPGPHAVYLYVKLEEGGELKCTLRLSDKIKDFEEERELPSSPMSLGNDEIARQLVASVVAETAAQ